MNRTRKFFHGEGFAVVVALIAGYLGSWRLQHELGTIGLFHDWSIYPAASQNVAYAEQVFNGWYRWILGEPVLYPTEYPLRFAFGAAGALGLGGDVVSHAFVFLIPAFAFFFAWLLARHLTGSQAGAITAGLFYAFSPVMLNKIASGQASYVVGYCALPLAIWAYERAITSRSFVAAAGFGAALAVTAVQLQLGIVTALLTMLYSAIPHRSAGLRMRLGLLGTGFLVALVIHLPTLVGVIGGAPGYENLAQFSNSTAYMSMNSVSFWDALYLQGYLTKYSAVAIAQWSTLWYGAMTVLLLGVFLGVVTASKRFRIFAIVALVGTFALMAGTHSPFGFTIIWLFQHVRYMEVFRELYHLMAVPALLYACCIAFFFRYIEQMRGKAIIYSAMALCVLMVSAPMLSGDASGWVRAFPLEQAYGDVLREQAHGNTRVLWLPMDQPLSFDGHGAGGDPMAVTQRGSLWDYALNWPLTAVDADIHDGGDLKSALRALSVGDVIDRQGMESQLYRFTVNGADTDPVLSQRAPTGLPLAKHYRQAQGYRVDDPTPFMSLPRQIAFVPQRLSVCAPAIIEGYAPIAIGAKRPSGMPYAVMYDPGDLPEESIEFAGVAKLLQNTSLDARFGFAPVNAWWWHRKEYADAPNLTLTFGQHATTVFTTGSFRQATVVLAWVSTPAGGRIRISAGRRSQVMETLGNGEWRSRAVVLGPLRQGARISLESMDYSAEVAIRGVTVVESSKYRGFQASWQRVMHDATAHIALTEQRQEVLNRTGTSTNLGFLENGAYYRFVPSSTRGVIRIGDPNGYVLARVTRDSVIFRGDGSVARLVASQGVGTWKLFKVIRDPLRLPKAPPQKNSRLVMWNWAYGDWVSSPSAIRFPSAIGTTIFAFSSPVAQPSIYYTKSTAFRVTYLCGTAVLLIALLMSFVRLVRRLRPVAVPRVNLTSDEASPA